MKGPLFSFECSSGDFHFKYMKYTNFVSVVEFEGQQLN
jgi:hypothetical protein